MKIIRLSCAVEVAKSLDLDHHCWTLDEDIFWKRLPSLSWSGEDLDLTVLFFQPLFEQMSKEVKVGICGQGADEIHAVIQGMPTYPIIRN